VTVPVSNAARLLWAIDRLCEESQQLHAEGQAPEGGVPLTPARFVEALTAHCDHPQARASRRFVWEMVATEAGVLNPDSRVRRQVLDYLNARSNAA
jgi:hypothetical protein